MTRRQTRWTDHDTRAPSPGHDPASGAIAGARPALKVLDLVAKGLELLGLLLLAVMALHIVVDVLLTALFAHPLTGTLEIVGHYYMVAIILLPLAALHIADQHISAEFFTQQASPRLRGIIDVASNVCLAGFSLIVVWQGSLIAWERTREAENIMVSQIFVYVWPSRWLVPLGFGLLALVALMKAAQALQPAPRHTAHPDPTGG